MIIYEFPLNEHIRNLLKLERVFQQALHFTRLDDALSHQVALFAIFDLLDIMARNDIKSELQLDLSRLRQRVEFRLEPSGSAPIKNEPLDHIDRTLTALQALPARLDQALRDHEWLNMVKQRANVPGGVNGYDLPHYHYWQHCPSTLRRANLIEWLAPALPVQHAISLILKRLREQCEAHALIARQGYYQQMLNGHNSPLLRIGLAENETSIPEASANRHAINIRFLTLNTTQSTRCEHDVEFQLSFCQP